MDYEPLTNPNTFHSIISLLKTKQLILRQRIVFHQIPIHPGVGLVDGIGAEDDFLGIVQEVHGWGAENVVVLGDGAVPFLVVAHTYEGEELAS